MALMWSGVSSPAEFDDLDYWASEALARELIALREDRLNFEVELAKAQIKASGARIA